MRSLLLLFFLSATVFAKAPEYCDVLMDKVNNACNNSNNIGGYNDVSAVLNDIVRVKKQSLDKCNTDELLKKVVNSGKADLVGAMTFYITYSNLSKCTVLVDALARHVEKTTFFEQIKKSNPEKYTRFTFLMSERFSAYERGNIYYDYDKFSLSNDEDLSTRISNATKEYKDAINADPVLQKLDKANDEYIDSYNIVAELIETHDRSKIECPKLLKDKIDKNSEECSADCKLILKQFVK